MPSAAIQRRSGAVRCAASVCRAAAVPSSRRLPAAATVTAHHAHPSLL